MVGPEGTNRIDRWFGSIDRTRGSARRFGGDGRTGGRGGVERRRGEEISLRAGVQELRGGGWGTREVRRLAMWRALGR